MPCVSGNAPAVECRVTCPPACLPSFRAASIPPFPLPRRSARRGCEIENISFMSFTRFCPFTAPIQAQSGRKRKMWFGCLSSFEAYLKNSQKSPRRLSASGTILHVTWLLHFVANVITSCVTYYILCQLLHIVTYIRRLTQ